MNSNILNTLILQIMKRCVKLVRRRQFQQSPLSSQKKLWLMQTTSKPKSNTTQTWKPFLHLSIKILLCEKCLFPFITKAKFLSRTREWRRPPKKVISQGPTTTTLRKSVKQDPAAHCAWSSQRLSFIFTDCHSGRSFLFFFGRPPQRLQGRLPAWHATQHLLWTRVFWVV